MGKCYKFHLTPKTWTDAQEKCRAEQSQLAVINSHEEAAFLVKLTRRALRSIPGRFTRGVVLLGFHNNDVEDWQTIDGNIFIICKTKIYKNDGVELAWRKYDNICTALVNNSRFHCGIDIVNAKLRS